MRSSQPPLLSLSWRSRLAQLLTITLFLTFIATPSSAQEGGSYADLVEEDGAVAFWRFEETECDSYYPNDPSSCRTVPTIGEIDGKAFASNVGLGGAVGLMDSAIAPVFELSIFFDSGILMDPFSESGAFDFSLHQDPVTLEAWIKTSQTSLLPMPIAGMDAGSGYAIQLDSEGRAEGMVTLLVDEDPPETEVRIVSDPASEPLNDGERHHVVLTKDATNIRLYVDGDLVDTTSSDGLPLAYVGCFCSFHDEAPFYIGRRLAEGETNPDTFGGVIDEVAVFPTALTASQIAAHTDFVRAFDCADVFMLGARGSGQDLDVATEDIGRFFDQLEEKIVDPNVTSIAERELGREPYEGHIYPAVGLDEPHTNLLEAFLGYFPGGTYRESVSEGIAEATAYLNDRAVACPDEMWALAGHSQGAQVIGEALFALTP